MTKSLPIRQAQPTVLENPKRVGEYIQGGVQCADFYNMYSALSIIVGEPFVIYGRIGITKRVIGPLEVGTVHFGCWMNFLADPDLAANILFGDKVYYDLDLADSDVPGYVTNVEPTNGLYLGYATTPHEAPGGLALGSGGKPIACKIGGLRCGVLMHTDEVVLDTHYFGNVPNYTAGTGNLPTS